MRKTTKWTKVFSFLLAFSLILIFAWSIQGQTANVQKKGKGGNGKGGGKPDEGGGYLSVSVMFRDSSPDRITSDSMGIYKDGTDGVLAIVGVKNGGFRLDTSGNVRTVNLTFSDQVDGAPSSGWKDIDMRLGEEWDNGWTETKLDIYEMEGGTTRYGALSISFTPAFVGRSSKLKYRMVFGKDESGWPSTCSTDFPYYVEVIRGGTAVAPLNEWTISATDVDLACLMNFSGKFKDAFPIGHFSMPFSIAVVADPVVEQP